MRYAVVDILYVLGDVGREYSVLENVHHLSVVRLAETAEDVMTLRMNETLFNNILNTNLHCIAIC